MSLQVHAAALRAHSEPETTATAARHQVTKGKNSAKGPVYSLHLQFALRTALCLIRTPSNVDERVRGWKLILPAPHTRRFQGQGPCAFEERARRVPRLLAESACVSDARPAARRDIARQAARRAGRRACASCQAACRESGRHPPCAAATPGSCVIPFFFVLDRIGSRASACSRSSHLDCCPAPPRRGPSAAPLCCRCGLLGVAPQRCGVHLVGRPGSRLRGLLANLGPDLSDVLSAGDVPLPSRLPLRGFVACFPPAVSSSSALASCGEKGAFRLKSQAADRL